MKPRKREIEIFNMSVLDLLTGALGAFCFLTLALFPSYYAYRAHERAMSRKKSAQEIQKAHKRVPTPTVMQPKVMPPYAAAIMQTVNLSGVLCGAMRITRYSGPGGRGAVGVIPSDVHPDGSYSLDELFITSPGRYGIDVMAASPQGKGCFVVFGLYTKRGEQVTDYPLTTRPARYFFKVEVKPEDLGAPSVVGQ